MAITLGSIRPEQLHAVESACPLRGSVAFTIEEHLATVTISHHPAGQRVRLSLVEWASGVRRARRLSRESRKALIAAAESELAAFRHAACAFNEEAQA